MKRAEAVELGVIVIAGATCALALRGRAFEMALGGWIAYGAILLLAQGLVRDLLGVATRRLAGRRAGGDRIRMKCLCAESSVGLLFGLVGLTLFFVGLGGSVRLGAGQAIGIGVAILFVGFVIKNYVITVRRVADHSLIDV
ncbi:MAG: hypothetical protein L0Z55_06720 [Planctomycetes bacterium]|nr:hypothetical protein [Planctomycetota bacterium]